MLTPWPSRLPLPRPTCRAARARPRLHGRARLPERARARPRGRRGRPRSSRTLRARARGRGPVGAAPPPGGGRHRHAASSPTRYLNEVIGRSEWAQLVFGCQAPDAGTREILHLFGTTEQQERFLRPLVAGEVRSFFSMTEPDVSGSDPTRLRTRAVLDGDEWVIDGHKWFSSGAEGAAFGIVMAVTDPDAPPHRRASQILVPADTPGFEIVRPIPVIGHRGRGWTTHCEVRYTGVRVPVANVARRAGRRLPDRAEAARAGAHPPRHALARPDAARVRADVRAARSSARRSAAARRQADRPELDRRLGRRDPGVPAADARRGAQDRRRATRRASRSRRSSSSRRASCTT